jgi:hypothetical protein
LAKPPFFQFQARGLSRKRCGAKANQVSAIVDEVTMAYIRELI